MIESLFLSYPLGKTPVTKRTCPQQSKGRPSRGDERPSGNGVVISVTYPQPYRCSDQGGHKARPRKSPLKVAEKSGITLSLMDLLAGNETCRDSIYRTFTHGAR